MVNREECVATINHFIATKELNDVLTLFTYMCDIKNVSYKEEAIRAVSNNPTLLAMIIDALIEALSYELHINKVTDKNNTLITVF